MIDPVSHVTSRSSCLSALLAAFESPLSPVPPRHLRRRTTSHRRFALPRKIRRSTVVTSVPSLFRPREHRRRPSLLRKSWEEEAEKASAYTPSSSPLPAAPTSVVSVVAASPVRWRLASHLWHAKRFFIGAAPKSWGPLLLPISRRDVGLQAVSRWWLSSGGGAAHGGKKSSPSALAHDASYWLPLYLHAPSINSLAFVLSRHIDTTLCPPFPSSVVGNCSSRGGSSSDMNCGENTEGKSESHPASRSSAARARRLASRAAWREKQWPVTPNLPMHSPFHPNSVSGASATQFWVHEAGAFPQSAIAPCLGLWVPGRNVASNASGVCLLLLVHAAGARGVCDALSASCNSEVKERNPGGGGPCCTVEWGAHKGVCRFTVCGRGSGEAVRKALGQAAVPSSGPLQPSKSLSSSLRSRCGAVSLPHGHTLGHWAERALWGGGVAWRGVFVAVR